jgi:hypothetical protein
MSAVMAAQTGVSLVYDQPGVAARAFRHPAAAVADQGRGETAPIDEQQDLLARRESRRHRLDQPAREAFGETLLTDVDHPEGRFDRAARTLRELE